MSKNSSPKQDDPKAMHSDPDSLAELIASRISSVSDTFIIHHNGQIECNIGGSFSPSIGEMHALQAYNSEDKLSKSSWSPGIAQPLPMGETLHFSNPAVVCYYEYLRSASNIKNIFARLEAKGVMEITITARTSKHVKIVQRVIIDFGQVWTRKDAPIFDLGTLPANGLLMLSVRGLGDKCAIRNFRWLGLANKTDARLGQRIYLIRTFGNKPLVTAFLQNLQQSLLQRAPEILQRSLFIVYDATGESIAQTVQPDSQLRLLELIGPNCGGGGNASLLFSLLLRMRQMDDNAIADVIMIDDDAKIDAECIIRHDGFVTGRKQNIITGAVVYKSDNPCEIQEYGGLWGKFFNKSAPAFAAAADTHGRVLFPLLPRSGWDMRKPDMRERLAVPQDADYATFIFISFPWQLAKKLGAPFPFFLRNDDVEICIRALQMGAKVLVNPNLHAWHNATHSPVAEFYAVLHSLILNATYDWLDKAATLGTLTHRIGSLMKAGNYILLASYKHVLQKFAAGPAWILQEDVFDSYLRTARMIKDLQQKCASPMPEAVVASKREHLEIYDLLHTHPALTAKETIIFYDHFQDSYFAQKRDVLGEECERLFCECLQSLAQIAANFDELAADWKNCVTSFDHVSFWNNILAKQPVAVQNESLARKFSQIEEPEAAANDQNAAEFSADGFILPAELAVNGVPEDFDSENYLKLNPDVSQSGMAAKEHWLRFGQYENRRY